MKSVALQIILRYIRKSGNGQAMPLTDACETISKRDTLLDSVKREVKMNEILSTKEYLIIKDLKKNKLASFKEIIVEALKKNIPVEIIINVKDAEEIIKGTFIAETLNRKGFECIGTITDDRVVWKCNKNF
jgi:uncharacterized FlgJ-related protein